MEIRYINYDMEDIRYGTYCSICGSEIVNRKLHSEWHQKAGF